MDPLLFDLTDGKENRNLSSDGNADMHVFARVLHLLGRPSANKRMANLVTEIVASNGSIMDQMNITMKSWKSKIQGIIKGGLTSPQQPFRNIAGDLVVSSSEEINAPQKSADCFNSGPTVVG